MVPLIRPNSQTEYAVGRRACRENSRFCLNFIKFALTRRICTVQPDAEYPKEDRRFYNRRLEQDFANEGGLLERMTRSRLNYRNKNGTNGTDETDGTYDSAKPKRKSSD